MKSVRKFRKHSYQKGEVFGRLTLTGNTYLKPLYGQQRRMIEANCLCGVTKWYLFESLIRGKTKSCGCLQKELTSKRRTTHGLRKHSLYTVYRGMKERCYRKKAINFPDYGARGIRVCQIWLNDFKVFYDWAIANGWKKGLDIDRRGNDGNYEPSNCRFITPKKGSRNRRSNRMVTAFGETKCLTEWSEDRRCKITAGRLWDRLSKPSDWRSIEEMITTPPKIRGFNIKNRAENKNIIAFGEEKSIAEWLKDERCVADEKRLRLRLRKGINAGWTPEKALTTHIRKLPPVI